MLIKAPDGKADTLDSSVSKVPPRIEPHTPEITPEIWETEVDVEVPWQPVDGTKEGVEKAAPIVHVRTRTDTPP